MSHVVKRPALGQMAQLGDLYDARTDTFCGLSIFKRQPPVGAVKVNDNESSLVHFVHGDNYREKFTKLQVTPNQSGSYLAGMVQVAGSGRYLNEQNLSERTIESSMLYNVTMRNEAVNLMNETMAECFALEVIEQGIGTHVVAEVSYGSNTIVSARIHGARGKTEAEGKVHELLQMMALVVDGNASAELVSVDLNLAANVEFKIFGDVLPPSNDSLSTLDEVVAYITKVPILAGETNEGRGKPILYTLVPISLIKKSITGQCTVENAPYFPVSERTMTRFVDVVDEFKATRQQLNDYSDDISGHFFCVPPHEFKRIVTLKTNLSALESQFRNKFSSLLKEVRSATADVADLDKLLKMMNDHETAPSRVQNDIDRYGSKMNFADSFTKKFQCKYIGFGHSLEGEMAKHTGEVYHFYFNESFHSIWAANFHLLKELVSSDPHRVMFLVDCDAQNHIELNYPKISVFRRGKKITNNLLAQRQSENDQCTVISGEGFVESLKKPMNRVPVKIACLGECCDNDLPHHWACSSCKEMIEFGFDEKFYCKCGGGPAIGYGFKCNLDVHGGEYVKFPDIVLQGVLDQLQKFPEINILILGETGVGKSTFINGLYNYLNYSSLEEAESAEGLLSLIPSSFTVTDEDYNDKEITTGNSANESLITGQSATQGAQVYAFYVKDIKLRIIDTPGVGDVRGIEQDAKNFENILSVISNLDQLHGIVILMKPNESRLDVMFRFCVFELLTHLHKGASENIVFGFTNARNTLYKPGETMPSLRKLLSTNPDINIAISKQTVYCFDSESYRFLAASKQGIKFEDEEREQYAQSWKHSVKETERLLAYVRERKPHPIQNTISLNNSRNLIIQLTEPMAEITRIINLNIAMVNDEVGDLQNTKLKGNQLRQSLMISKVILEPRSINMPRTVCTHSDCIQVVTQNGNQVVNYIQRCHDPCSLTDVPVNTQNTEKLLRCWAFYETNTICRHVCCGHSYLEHMHIVHELIEKTVTIEDEHIRQALYSNANATQLREAGIAARQKLLKEYELEHQRVERAAAQFGCFLKNNAITPYNDARLEYLDRLIKTEKQKIDHGGKEEVLERLEKSKMAYIEELKILNLSMKKGSGGVVLAAANVPKIVNELLTLKHFGATLKKVRDSDVSVRASEYVEHSCPVVGSGIWSNPLGALKGHYKRFRDSRLFGGTGRSGVPNEDQPSRGRSIQPAWQRQGWSPRAGPSSQSQFDEEENRRLSLRNQEKSRSGFGRADNGYQRSSGEGCNSGYYNSDYYNSNFF